MEQESKEYALVKIKPRSQKLKPRIDLSSMVSVSFLLIIFFMVTKELAKPQAMDLGLPENCGGDGTIYCGPRFNRTLTLLLDDDNKIISYYGLLNFTKEMPKRLGYGKNGIRTELIQKNKMINQNFDRNLIVIIKPGKKSNYGNLVDILDEMTINKIPTYAIVNDFTPEESELLVSN